MHRPTIVQHRAILYLYITKTHTHTHRVYMGKGAKGSEGRIEAVRKQKDGRGHDIYDI